MSRRGPETQIGPTELIPPSSQHTRVDPSRVLLFVAAGPDQGRSKELSEAPSSVGSDPDCDLVLADGTVSRRHLEVVWNGQEALVRDLGSTNGTYYGEARIREIAVGFGAEVRLGRTRLRILPSEQAVAATPSRQEAFGSLVGRHVQMREIFALLADLAPTDATVVVEGETGTGKELVARAIHDHSERAKGPYVVFDCSAVPRDLMESSLFGHVKGAFTGATQTRAGAFERANGGTIFLDEIGELDLALQPKLLRILEAREVQKVGGDETTAVDVRVIAATNRNLKAEVKAGRFREDLYYRLAVVKLAVPPLRDRRDDIPLLVETFLDALGADAEARDRVLTPDNLRVLSAHGWPGNVRELRNVVERVHHLARGRDVAIARFLTDGDGEAGEAASAVDDARSIAVAAAFGDGSRPLPFKDAKQSMVEAFEKSYIEDLLRRNDGNISGASREAGIDRKHFKELMKKYEIR
jgi:DNA-binding NtrC family response regulator